MIQPDRATKLATLRGEDTGWDYRFDPGLLPPQAHSHFNPPEHRWTPDDWIQFIGDNWFRKSKETGPRTAELGPSRRRSATCSPDRRSEHDPPTQ